MKLRNIGSLAALATGAVVMLGGAQPAQATTVATISGAYDAVGCAYDTPCLVFHNTSGGTFMNAQMVLTGYDAGSLTFGLTQTVALPNMGIGDTTIVWSSPTEGPPNFDFTNPPGTGPLAAPFFIFDYDDSGGSYGGLTMSQCPTGAVNTSLCADIGNFSVAFTATISGGTFNGDAIHSVFSPDSNFTGGFVGWEGINPKGQSEDPLDDVHTGSLSGTLANIDLGALPTPEPSSITLLGVGLIGLVTRVRRRR